MVQDNHLPCSVDPIAVVSTVWFMSAMQAEKEKQTVSSDFYTDSRPPAALRRVVV